MKTANTKASEYREAILAYTTGKDHHKLCQMIGKHQSKTDDFNLDDVVQSLSKKQHDILWSGMLNICNDMRRHLGPVTSEDQENLDQIEEKEVFSCLGAILVVMTTYMEQEQSIITANMIECATVLHDTLMDLPDSQEKLRMKIAKLLRIWWVQGFPGKEDVAPNMMVCLITKSLQPNAHQVDVKAVNAISGSLHLVNWEDSSSLDIEVLLQQCMISPNFLKVSEGRSFLGGLFGLNQKLINKLHAAIKGQLPSSSKADTQHYGEIYFKAWKNASGNTLTRIEQSCIQDLMFHAVHANRTGSRSLATVLQQLLGYFSHQKRQQGVDKMLCTLYEPILWRALNAANLGVRVNAACLLIDAFPLQDPESNKENMDAMLQKQIDALNTLLCDPCPSVRVTAVQGVCKVVSVYWELLPVAAVTSFLAKLVQEQVYDTSSPDVRMAVFKGLKYILDNPLSHPLLKRILPSLGDFIHDTSEKVIISFLELLLKVKGIRTIKVSSIVSIEHLLARLEVASPPLARRLVTLLFNSFHPVNQEANIKIERVMRLIQTNEGACRIFYRHAASQMSTADAVDFMLLLCRCIRGCIKASQGETPSMDASGDSGITGESQHEMDKENDGGEEDDDGLSLKDKDVLNGMLEIIAILWIGLGDELAKPSNEHLKIMLVKKFSKALPDFLATFQDARSVSAITILASYLPASSIPSFSNGCLSTLKNLPVTADEDSFSPLLTCLVSWGRGKDILELIGNWLDMTLTAKQTDNEREETDHDKPRKKKKKRVAFVEPIQPQPLLGLRYLDCLLSHYPSRARLLQSCLSEIIELMLTIKKVMPCIEQRFLSGAVLSFTTDEVLQKSINAYLRLLLHIQSKINLGGDQQVKVEELNFNAHYEELLSWMSRELVPSLAIPSSNTSRGSRSGLDVTLHQLSKQITKNLLELCTDSLMLGVDDSNFPDQLSLICKEVLQTDCSVVFLPISIKVMYHLSQTLLKEYIEKSENKLEGSITSLLVAVIKTLSQEEQKEGLNENNLREIMTNIKPGLTESLKLCQRHRNLCPSLDQNVIALVMAGIVSGLSSAIVKSGQVPFEPVDSIGLLPPVPSLLLFSVTSTAAMVGSFVREVHQCVRSGALEKTADICAVLHILHTLSKDKNKLTGLDDCLRSIEAQLDSMESGLEDGERGREDGDEKKDKEENDKLDRFWIFESRKLLNSLLGKEPPPKPTTEISLSTSAESSSSSLNKSKKKLYNSNSSSLLM